MKPEIFWGIVGFGSLFLLLAKMFLTRKEQLCFYLSIVMVIILVLLNKLLAR